MKSFKQRSKLFKITIYSLLTITALIATTIIVVKTTPRPIAFLAKKVIFDPTPNKKSPHNFDDILNEVSIETDIEYPSNFNNNLFDLYTPKDSNGPLPVVIWAHGGGFVGGDKFMVSDYATIIAQNKVAVVAFNYTLAPDYHYPTPINQISEVIDHLLKSKSKYNIDMNNVIFAGDSAGAQIASQYVITQTNTNYNNNLNITKQLNSDQIKGMLLYCGIYDIEDLLNTDNSVVNYIFNNLGWAYLGEKHWTNSYKLQEASIINNVDENFPPVYLTDGNTLSFEGSARKLLTKLSSLNIKNTSRFFPKNEVETMHEFQFDLQSEEGLLVLEDTLLFLSDVLK